MLLNIWHVHHNPKWETCVKYWLSSVNYLSRRPSLNCLWVQPNLRWTLLKCWWMRPNFGWTFKCTQVHCNPQQVTLIIGCPFPPPTLHPMHPPTLSGNIEFPPK